MLCYFCTHVCTEFLNVKLKTKLGTGPPFTHPHATPHFLVMWDGIFHELALSEDSSKKTKACQTEPGDVAQFNGFLP